MFTAVSTAGIQSKDEIHVENLSLIDNKRCDRIKLRQFALKTEFCLLNLNLCRTLNGNFSQCAAIKHPSLHLHLRLCKPVRAAVCSRCVFEIFPILRLLPPKNKPTFSTKAAFKSHPKHIQKLKVLKHWHGIHTRWPSRPCSLLHMKRNDYLWCCKGSVNKTTFAFTHILYMWL